MSGKLSTHVLDLTQGRPASGMKIELWLHHPTGSPTVVKTVTTNADGRTDAPLLDQIAMTPGAFELVFFVRDYFTARGVACEFFDRVPIRFTITSATQPYHVPLLVTPWAYNTYRGS
jgi:5-hydroxyisourate hydrolase